MNVMALAFYLFATTVVVSGAMVITAKNPVHSVLWLILAFFNAAGLFLLLGAEFLAMILVIVYVGAVAVLFLFVVMMLDINFEELRKGFLAYLPMGMVLGAFLLVELLIVVGGWVTSDGAAGLMRSPTPVAETNTRALGDLIYTHYIYLFEVSGLILLVAMIGAIVLTHRSRPGVRRQNIGEQVMRQPRDATQLVDVVSGEGLPG